ncbi:MAG: hypothetical protein ACREP8_04040, partial [Candidatus Binatia bacterium]
MSIYPGANFGICRVLSVGALRTILEQYGHSVNFRNQVQSWETVQPGPRDGFIEQKEKGEISA